MITRVAEERISGEGGGSYAADFKGAEPRSPSQAGPPTSRAQSANQQPHFAWRSRGC